MSMGIVEAHKKLEAISNFASEHRQWRRQDLVRGGARN